MLLIQAFYFDRFSLFDFVEISLFVWESTLIYRLIMHHFTNTLSKPKPKSKSKCKMSWKCSK